MPPEDAAIAAYVDATAKLIGLPIDPAHRPGVIANMARNAQMAAFVMAAPAELDGDAAPVFVP
jgi:hypothetical protein